ncbi:MAG: 50S ribosomal protein L15 [Alphaproteobacteria bacterium]|jgi:large subunit ribosomal protein L15|nr:50S ribosomal protein L15 [Alphaproteobacteria bacterium]MBT5389688.1 50S ribosomal protein L15 [Alphaproteobacteria bacterium]MBT5654114.1 50S ribosomal protein L15 [Alphaproteobacteria bacterium]
MKLNEIRDNSAARKAPKRVGRGIGSGTGKTCGRGVKGQKSRTGVAIKGFEGGQMPLYQRLPKRGFKNIFSKKYRIVNTGALETAIKEGRLSNDKKITPEVLEKAGLIRENQNPIRLLGKGELSQKIEIEVAYATKGAIQAVEKQKGQVHLPQQS